MTDPKFEDLENVIDTTRAEDEDIFIEDINDFDKHFDKF